MKLSVQTIRILAYVVGGLDVIWTILWPLLERGETLDVKTALVAVGPALIAYVSRGPGHVTQGQAEQMADARARDAVRASKMPPAP